MRTAIGGGCDKQQQPRQPGGGVHLVEVADHAAVKAAAGERESGNQARQPTVAGAAHEQKTAEGEQPGVQGGAEVDLLGDGEPEQRKMERIEECGLRVGKEGRTHEDVGIPEGDASAAQGFAGVGAIGREVEQDVAGGEHAIAEEQRGIERRHEEGEKQCGIKGVR